MKKTTKGIKGNSALRIKKAVAPRTVKRSKRAADIEAVTAAAKEEFATLSPAVCRLLSRIQLQGVDRGLSRALNQLQAAERRRVAGGLDVGNLGAEIAAVAKAQELVRATVAKALAAK